MKEAPYTTPPIVAKQNEAGGWKRLLFGHTAADAYYEALDIAGRWYLWMEFSRFGSLRAYPCALSDGEETTAYRPYGDNAGFLERWESLLTPDTIQTLKITELTKADFQRIYRGIREAESKDASGSL